MNVDFKVSRAMLMACVLALGLGCEPPITVLDRPVAAAADTTQGVVLVSITSNTARAGAFDGLQVEREASGADPAHSYLLSQVAPGLSRDTSLFVGILPAGTYSFEKLTTGQQYIALGKGGRELLGRFQVGSGETVDLGRLILTAINAQVLLGRSARATDNGDLARASAPDQAAFLARKRGTGWLAPRSKDDFVEAYALATPIGADGLRELPGGYVAACSRMGVLMVRQPSGRWGGLSTGSLASLLALAPVEGSDTKVVVAGEFRTLARVDGAWKVSPIDPGNLPMGNLFFIDGSEKDGWVVGHQAGKTMAFYRSQKLEAGDWKLLRQEAFKDSFWSGANHAWAWRTPTGFAFATTFGGLHAWDREKDAWSRLPLPKDANPLDFSILDAWSVLTSPGGGFGGIFSSLSFSTDQGRTWEAFPSPFNVKVKAPLILGGGKLLMQGGPKGLGAPELKLSEDAGKTWSVVSGKVAAEETLVWTPTQGLFAIETGGQSFGLAHISNSKDLGRTWEVEWSNFNRAFYERTTKK